MPKHIDIINSSGQLPSGLECITHDIAVGGDGTIGFRNNNVDPPTFAITSVDPDGLGGAAVQTSGPYTERLYTEGIRSRGRLDDLRTIGHLALEVIPPPQVAPWVPHKAIDAAAVLGAQFILTARSYEQ